MANNMKHDQFDEPTQFHMELGIEDSIPAALLLLTLSSSCPDHAPHHLPATPPQTSFHFSFESNHFTHHMEKADDMSAEDETRVGMYNETPLSESAGNRKQQHRISKKCHGCGLFKKRVYRYLGATASFCNACNQHWRRHSHHCSICMRLQQAGAAEELRGIDIGGKAANAAHAASSAASSVGSPSGMGLLTSHRTKMSPTGPRALQRTHWQVAPQGQSL
eukprot:TRINITY_DN129_c1_g2_i1.p1 TRINITY_DN129_c1_g2~~TRINITY_DN129_c1_g2_i1.p1  ORF type:complete len:220 (+),score=36.10 TRINITY_DN129_c1_g2_i1:148-807(+)